MPVIISFPIREQIANRLNGGQGVKGVAAEMNISLITMYRLAAQFRREDGMYDAVPAQVSHKEKISREQLLAMTQIVEGTPKITLQELAKQAVQDGVFQSAETVPHISTIHRALVRVGFKWQKPRYSDPRSSRDVIKFERCNFRKHQDDGLDPEKLLSFDESNFYYEQATRAWGTTYVPATLLQPKGKVMRRSLLATIGFKKVGAEYKALIHWLLIPPRRSWRPLGDVIEAVEIEPSEKEELKQLTKLYVDSLGVDGLKAKLKDLSVRSEEKNVASMRATLIRIGRAGSREGELRSSTQKGRPSLGGKLVAPTGDSRQLSEYLHQCLVPFLNTGELWAADKDTCALTMNEGVRSCPDGGVRQYTPKLNETTVVWDSAPSHLPANSKKASGFEKYAKEVLGFKGILHTPPYSPWFAPIELFFSFVKRYVRKFAPATLPELLVRIREAVQLISGSMIKNWFKKCGYIVPGEELDWADDEQKDQPDPCTLPQDHKFSETRQHIVCVARDGTVAKEKKTRHSTWSKWEEKPDLQDMSVTKSKGVKRKRKRVTHCDEPGEGTRYVGFGEVPPDTVFPEYDQLFQNDDDQAEVEGILDEREPSSSSSSKQET